MGKHRQGHVYIYVEPPLTGPPGEVKEMDADAEAILHAMASSVAGDEVPCPRIAVVGQKEGRREMP